MSTVKEDLPLVTRILLLEVQWVSCLNYSLTLSPTEKEYIAVHANWKCLVKEALPDLESSRRKLLFIVTTEHVAIGRKSCASCLEKDTLMYCIILFMTQKRMVKSPYRRFTQTTTLQIPDQENGLRLLIGFYHLMVREIGKHVHGGSFSTIDYSSGWGMLDVEMFLAKIFDHHK